MKQISDLREHLINLHIYLLKVMLDSDHNPRVILILICEALLDNINELDYMLYEDTYDVKVLRIIQMQLEDTRVKLEELNVDIFVLDTVIEQIKAICD